MSANLFSFVTSGFSAFAGTAGSLVTWTTPFSWNPANTPITDLWKFTSGGRTYAFDADILANHPPADIELAAIGDLCACDRGALLKANQAAKRG